MYSQMPKSYPFVGLRLSEKCLSNFTSLYPLIKIDSSSYSCIGYYEIIQLCSLGKINHLKNLFKITKIHDCIDIQFRYLWKKIDDMACTLMGNRHIDDIKYMYENYGVRTYLNIINNDIIFKYLIKSAQKQNYGPLDIHIGSEKLFIFCFKLKNITMLNYIIELSSDPKYNLLNMDIIILQLFSNITFYFKNGQMLKYLVKLCERDEYTPLDIHRDNEILFRHYWKANNPNMINYLLKLAMNPIYGPIDIHVNNEILFRSILYDEIMTKEFVIFCERSMHSCINIHANYDEAMVYYTKSNNKDMIKYLIDLANRCGYIPYPKNIIDKICSYVNNFVQNCID